MNTDLVRELFRSLENTLYERVRIIEDILNKTNATQGMPPAPPPSPSPEYEEMMQRWKDLAILVQSLEQRMTGLETNVARIGRLEEAVSRLLTAATEKEERCVDEVEAELEVETAELEALDADVDASALEIANQQSLRRAVSALPERPEEQEKAAEDADDEAEEELEEDEVEEEEVEEEVSVAEEESDEDGETTEEEELAVEEFEYRKRTYYRDTANNVYAADEDGDIVSEPIGTWNPQTKKIVPLH